MFWSATGEASAQRPCWQTPSPASLPTRSVPSQRRRAHTPETHLKLHQRDKSKPLSPLFSSLKRPWYRRPRSEGPDKVILWYPQSGSIPTSRSTMQAIRPNIDHCQTLAERWSAQLRLCIAKKGKKGRSDGAAEFIEDRRNGANVLL